MRDRHFDFVFRSLRYFVIFIILIVSNAAVIMSNGYGFNSDDSPNKTVSRLQIPSPIITRRNRTASTSERALGNPLENGKIKSFCRERGHGFVTPSKGGEDIFVHISDIEGEYVPLPGDEVMYRLCPIPPKFEKFQAVHVCIVTLVPERHSKWDEPTAV